MAVNPLGTILAIADGSPSVKLIDAKTMICSGTLEGKINVRFLSFTPDGSQLVTGADNTFWNGQNGLFIWHISLRRLLSTIDVQESITNISVTTGSNSGLLFATGGWRSCYLKLWDSISCKCVATFRHNSTLGFVSFNPSGSLVAGIDCSLELRIWDVKLGVCQHTFFQVGYTSGLSRFAFLADGDTIVAAAPDHKLQLLRISTKECAPFVGAAQGGPVSGVAVSPCGRFVFSTSEGPSAVRIWDVVRHSDLETFHLEGEGQNCLVFNPNGTHLYSCGNDDGPSVIRRPFQLVTHFVAPYSQGTPSPSHASQASPGEVLSLLGIYRTK
jgi:WD40 repeat protein